VEQKDAAGTLCGLRHDRDHMTRDPALLLRKISVRVFLQEHFFGIGSCDSPGERAVRNKNSLVEMFLQEHPCRSVAFAL